MATAGWAAEPTTEQKIEILSAEIEQLKQQVGGASGGPNRVSVGGYGELHFNNLENRKDGSGRDMIDFHRFVLFFGYAFSDSIRFFSEVEIEHALVKDNNNGTGQTSPGEVELEQAYLEFDLSPMFSAKGGLFLIPVGILNETHEPPTFYGVERNNVESSIVPTTWWESGAAVTAKLGAGFSADLAYHSGLKVGNNFQIRGGRQKSASATANDPAYTGRIKWTGVPGVEWAMTVIHQKDIGQGLVPDLGRATLYESHAVVNRGRFGLRALYAQWQLAGDGPAAAGADKQYGWYVEPSLKLGSQWGVFARYSRRDTQAHDATASDMAQIDVGVNYWPHPQVVIKADVQNQKAPLPGVDEIDGFNLGIGYMF
ncbi:MAG TPA: hypothetical protein VGA00_14960 [Acidiferrobacterales bacterium]